MTTEQQRARTIRGFTDQGPQALFGIDLGGLARAAGGAIAGLVPGGRTVLDIGRGLVGGGGRTAPGRLACPSGSTEIGGTCVDLSAALPGGAPLFPGRGPGPSGPIARRPTTSLAPSAGGSAQFGAAVIGAFGLPALEPAVFVDESTRDGVRRRCPGGMRLGQDDLCYPKGVLQKRSKFRKWKAPPAPGISAHTLKVARTSATAQKRIVEIGHLLGGTGGKKSVTF